VTGLILISLLVYKRPKHLYFNSLRLFVLKPVSLELAVIAELSFLVSIEKSVINL
jgi:hypothetical protein